MPSRADSIPGVAPGSAELPQRSEATLMTTVSAPLGQWVTLAATGADDGDANVVASGQAAARRVLQLRVSLQPWPACERGCRSAAVRRGRECAQGRGHSTHIRSGCFMRPACCSAASPQPQK